MFNSNIANIYISIFIIFISEIASTYIDLAYISVDPGHRLLRTNISVWILDTDFCGRMRPQTNSPAKV